MSITLLPFALFGAIIVASAHGFLPVSTPASTSTSTNFAKLQVFPARHNPLSLLIQRLQWGAPASYADGKRSNIGHTDKENLNSKRKRRRSCTQLFIGTGFSFDDGEQVLVSVQKPLGIILEQQEEDGPVMVGEVDPSGSAGRAGVQEGDILVALQNASVETQSLEYVMDFLGRAPKVVNLRFVRPR